MRPEVSAICVTHPSRFAPLQRAILSFGLQSSCPDRELLVLTSSRPHWERIGHWIRRLAFREKIRVCLLPPFEWPAEAAAHAFAMAEADVLTGWDDDDLSHPLRLRTQLDALGDRPAAPRGSLYWFAESEELFVVDDHAQPAGPTWARCASSAVMFRRRHYRPVDFRAPGLPWTAVAMSASPLVLDFVDLPPFLFMQGVCGDNLRGGDYHRFQVSRLPGCRTREQLLSSIAEVDTWLHGYRFDVEEITLSGRDVQACGLATTVWTPPPGEPLAAIALPEELTDRVPSPEVRRAVAEVRQQAVQQAKQQARQKQPQTQRKPATAVRRTPQPR